MKRKIKIFGISFIIANLLTICLSIKSNAAMEIKSGGTKYSVRTDQAFHLCYNLRKDTTTLSKNTLDPHLSLNAEWAAVMYLSKSSYGLGWSGSGVYSAGNISSVDKSGKSNMACILEEVDEKFKGTKLYEYSNTKYVEKLKTEYTLETTKGLGFGLELGYNTDYPTSSNPYIYI